MMVIQKFESSKNVAHGLYRVAQNKMLHRIKCNFSTINRDFSIDISGFKEDFPT